MKTNWPIWKAIKLGTYRDANAIKTEIKNAGMKIGDWGIDILTNPTFTVRSIEVNILLTRITVADLGFEIGATYEDLCAKALGQLTTVDGVKYEIALCPNEVGPQLRMQYTDQPKSEWIRIAMKPIPDSNGTRRIFSVIQDDDDLWLRGDNGYEGDSFYYASHVFVFVLQES